MILAERTDMLAIFLGFSSTLAADNCRGDYVGTRSTYGTRFVVPQPVACEELPLYACAECLILRMTRWLLNFTHCECRGSQFLAPVGKIVVV